MGFSEGLEDEFLLTCFVCKAPFGMVAMFCGECGSRREQALGIEKAAVHQQIINNMPEAESYIEKAPDANVIPEYDEIFGQPGSAPNLVAAEIKPIKEHKLRNNIAIRTGKLNQFQQDHARTLNAAGLILFIASLYMVIQTAIFAGSNPTLATDDILKQATSHNSAYFDLLGADSSHKYFPSKFQAWSATDATSWLTRYEANGWLGKGTVYAVAVGKNVGDDPIAIQVKAVYTAKMGIFREVSWEVVNPPATFTLNYPTGSSTLIYINGIAAGTIAHPAVPAGTYWVYPGPMSVKYYEDGSETYNSFDLFINAYGDYSSY
jgi:hypothetical protein